MVEIVEIQPWGYAPTPIIPKALLKELGHHPLPTSLRQELGNRRELHELHSEIWNSTKSVEPLALNTLVQNIGPKIRSLGHIVLRSNEPLLLRFEELPFSTRTRNAVLRNTRCFSAENLTIRDVLGVPGLGVKSVIEFASILEVALSLSSSGSKSVQQETTESTFHVQRTPSELKSFFQLLAAHAVGERNLGSMASVLPDANEDWPPEIKHLWGQVGVLDANELAGELAQRYSVVALLDKWTKPIKERLRDILVRRTFRTDRRDTLQDLGEHLDITRERVRQLEKKALEHLARLKHAEFAPIFRTAERLRCVLGSAVPEADWNVAAAVSEFLPGFDELDDEMSDIALGLLVYLAGPYKSIKSWVVSDKDLASKSMDQLMARVDERGCIRDEVMSATLASLGILDEYQSHWVHHLRKFKRVEGGYINLTGTLLDKARALLTYHESPLTVEEMIVDLGSDSARSVRQRLIDDPGFWRINKQNQFVLADTPGYDEYTGITDEIVQELEACGGRATVQHLVSKLTSVYGVKENSVNAYLSTPMFTRDAEGLVRLRRDGEPIELDLDIAKAAGCYVDGDGNWCWRVEVDSALMRGSGRMTPNAFADLFGCGINDKIEIQSDCGPIVLSWPASSSAGASIGSIRQAISDLHAGIGDFIFVVKTQHGMSFTCLSAEVLESVSSKLERLLMLVGRHEVAEYSEMVSQLASALQVSGANDEERAAACRLKLKSRGEDGLAQHIEEPKLSVEGYLSSMEELFKQ